MSITREENGTYTSQVRVKDWTGKTIHKKKRGFKRKKDAKEWEKTDAFSGEHFKYNVERLL